MKKFKTRYVKFVFTPKQHRGSDWATAAEPDYRFGNRYTDTIHQYNWDQNHISIIFSDELYGDPRKYDKKVKFTKNEAHILLLKYLEDNLKNARKEKRRLDEIKKRVETQPIIEDVINLELVGYDYARTVNNRNLEHNSKAVKKYRKIVKEILASKEYMWEQLNK